MSPETSPPGTAARQTSPIWRAALDRYYSELKKGGISATTIDKEVWNVHSPEELLAQIESLRPPQSSTWSIGIKQLQPVLLSLSDFAALAAWGMGNNGKVAAVLWGSFRVLVKYAKPVFPDVVGAMQGLQKALPRIRQYEEELPMTDSLEQALFELYTEIIIFCAHAISFFFNNPGANPRVPAWLRFSTECSRAITAVQRLSRRVDEAADLARYSKQASTTETVGALEALQKLYVTDDPGAKLPCFMIPYGLNLRFFGRSEELQRLRDELDPTDESDKLRAIGIYGLGGVGKSQLALQYANTSLEKYDVIAWVPAETRIKLVQALSALANKLGLTDTGGEDDAQNTQKVRDWLNTSKRSFLLIFDNVDSVSLLDEIWPASPKASIIITTRSQSQATKRALSTLNLGPFSVKNGTAVFKSLTGMEITDNDESNALEEICRRVGGLPLAMVQLSDFIRDRNYSFTELLRIYDKSAEKVYNKSDRPVEYDHTVLTTWDISLQKLSDEARLLQNLLIFFDPDSLLERLITGTKAEVDDKELLFLLDEFDFTEAVTELCRTSMVSRLEGLKAISVHRLVQLAVFLQLSAAERISNFDLAVKILYFDFPNTWQNRGAHQGHGWASWETCSAILPHVNRLMQLSEKHKIKTSKPDIWAELVFRTGAYLWEKEQPSIARTFFEFGLRIDSDLPAQLAAQAHRLLGHVSLDLAQPRAALIAYSEALRLRTELEAPESPPIADVLDSLACANVEANNVPAAFAQLDRATAIHNAHNSANMSRTLAIRAMACLRAGDPDGALTDIRHCWELQGLDEARIETSRYPKHSGDVMLLSRIYWLQGRRAEARELASRSIAMRKGTFGDKGGPRVADSLFTVARMLEEGGERVLAAKMLRQVMDVCGEAEGMRPHLARALWFLAGVEEGIGGEGDEVRSLRDRATEVRANIAGREWPDEDTDESFLRLVAWMLW